MDGICISCIIKFLYLGFTIIYAMGWNVPSTVWLNHHTCFQPATWMPETYSSWEHIILYAKIIAVHVQCPNKLLHNNDGHELTLHANIAQKNHTIDYHRLPRNDIARKNLSITLKDIFP